MVAAGIFSNANPNVRSDHLRANSFPQANYGDLHEIPDPENHQDCKLQLANNPLSSIDFNFTLAPVDMEELAWRCCSCTAINHFWNRACGLCHHQRCFSRRITLGAHSSKGPLHQAASKNTLAQFLVRIHVSSSALLTSSQGDNRVSHGPVIAAPKSAESNL